MRRTAGTVLLLVILAVVGHACRPHETADLVLLNGNFRTLDPDQPHAQAVAIKGEWIVALGRNEVIWKYVGDETEILVLDGAFVTPGFNDAHVHVQSTGALLTGANLLAVHEPVAFVEEIRAATTRLPEGSWITRGDWGAYEAWQEGSAGEGGSSPRPADNQPFTPHRALIDSVTPNHPVLVRRFDGSMYLANTVALQLAGISSETRPPAGGTIERDDAGEPTGILRGTAVELVTGVIPPISFEQRLAQVRAVLEEARVAGITTIQDITSAAQLAAYRELQRRGELTARIMIRPSLDNVVHTAALGITEGIGDDWIKFIGYKAWVDGIMGNSSAMFFSDYDHDAGNRGRLRTIMLPESVDGAAMSMGVDDHYSSFPPGNLERLVDQAVDTRLPPHVHAIGTLGVRIILDTYQRVLTERDMVDGDHRWRVIHAQVVRPEDMPRFGELNLVAEVNPYHVSDDMRWMEERIGRERSRGAYAFRALKEAGAVVIFGSDSPGTNAARYYLNPVYGLYAAVTRQTVTGEPADGWFPDQRFTIGEAIEAYTKAPAWASFEEDIKGTVSVGKLADLTVWGRNLIDLGYNDSAALLEAEVLYTIVGGRVVFQHPTFEEE
ncbi:MAG: amidohydrolase [Gemmatimonadales bacterium]